MIDLSKEIPNENLTQKDIMQFLLHSTQHVATREELKDVKDDLSKDIEKVDDKISKLATKEELAKLDDKIDKVETSLKADIAKLDDKIARLDDKIDKLDDKISVQDDKISKLATKEELAKVESSLRADIVKLDQKIDKVDGKFDRLQWLIIATIATVLLKDYIIGLIN